MFERTFERTLFKLVDLQICGMENINSNAHTLYIDFHTIFPNECYFILYLYLLLDSVFASTWSEYLCNTIQVESSRIESLADWKGKQH